MTNSKLAGNNMSKTLLTAAVAALTINTSAQADAESRAQAVRAQMGDVRLDGGAVRILVRALVFVSLIGLGVILHPGGDFIFINQDLAILNPGLESG